MNARGQLAEVFKRAGILGQLMPGIWQARWLKLLWNASFNPVTALSRANVGRVLDDPNGLALIRSLMGEIIRVAQAEGVALSEKNIDDELKRSQNHLRTVRTSTLQDFERGKPLEYDALTGAVIRAASRAWNRGSAYDGGSCTDRYARSVSEHFISLSSREPRQRVNDRPYN